MIPRNGWKFHKHYRICSTQDTILSFFRVFLGKICILSDFRAVVPGRAFISWNACGSGAFWWWVACGMRWAAYGIYGIHFLTSYFFNVQNIGPNTEYMREVSPREDLSPACLGASQSHSSPGCVLTSSSSLLNGPWDPVFPALEYWIVETLGNLNPRFGFGTHCYYLYL